MSFCPSCGGRLVASDRFCSGCGTEVSLTSTPTLAAGSEAPTTPAPAAPPGSGRDDVRFVPGTLVSERYRVVAVLGRGGMGEVYRADDLKLGEPVALKFLPVQLAADSRMVGRFHEEVRISRQISHPNICTVHDIGEVEGHHYLSMEYVDGEDLSSLLRRVGRLSNEKAGEIGRQICAGLSAAHSKGVIHRDLKPGNILIDGLGHARVTDFGLAAMTRQLTGAEARSGTPAYMAPEQLAGEQVTAASDIYSLGLVLYELFSGRKAFEGDTLAHRLESRSEPSPVSASHVSGDIEPRINRIIERCLDPDPARRPHSALEVAAHLPGGDLLASSLAAGKTPSPEMVAAAGSSGALRPGAAALCLATVLAGCLALAGFSDRLYMYRRAPMEKPPDALVEQARQLIAELGFRDPVRDWASGFYYRGNYIQHLARIDEPGKWDRISSGQPAAVGFWYRQSPASLVPLNIGRVVQIEDPPFNVAGMISVRLDSEGRLLRFSRVPGGSGEKPSTQGATANWRLMIERAGLDPTLLRSTDPGRTLPPVFADERFAWTGAYETDTPIRIEAGSVGGRPVYFEVLEPWNLPAESEAPSPGEEAAAFQDRAQLIAMFVLVVVFGVAVWMARRNLRRGRGDRKGAFRVAAVACTGLASSLFLESHRVPATINDFGIAGSGPLAVAVPLAFLIWLLYLAVEPYLRKLWPRVLISWERLLRGDWTNPMIGRDILVGGVLSALTTLLLIAVYAESGWQLAPITPTLRPFLSTADAISLFLNVLTFNAPFNPLLIIFVILLLRVVLRRVWLAATIAGAIMVAITLAVQAAQAPGSVTPLFAVLQAVGVAATLLVLLRFGILALMVGSAFQQVLLLYPASVELGSWYATTALMPYLVIVGLSGYGFYVSLAGSELFTMRTLEGES